MQIPVQIDSHGRTLLGMIRLPARPAPGAPCVLMTYGLNGDRVDNHRLSVDFARAANRAGVAVVSFDYGGCGLSSGEFHDASIATKVEDTVAVIDFLGGCFGDEPFELVMLGYSDGVRVVHEALQRRPRVGAVCLWNPIFHSMTEEFRPAQRRKMALEPKTKKLVFPLFGVYLGVDYLRDANSSLALDDFFAHGLPCLCVFGGGDRYTLELQRELRARAPDGGFELCTVEGANHLFNHSTWSAELIQNTVSWISKVVRR